MFIWSSQHEIFFNLNKITAFWYEERKTGRYWVLEVEGFDHEILLTPEEFKRYLMPRIAR